MNNIRNGGTWPKLPVARWPGKVRFFDTRQEAVNARVAHVRKLRQTDNMGELVIVVSGIPASGKTRLGTQLSEALQLPCVDKDDILETLFDSLGVGDSGWRQRLSRASDAILMNMIRAIPSGVFVSFWRHPNSPSKASGTPINWMLSDPRSIVEVHCRCDPHIATVYEPFSQQPLQALLFCSLCRFEHCSLRYDAILKISP